MNIVYSLKDNNIFIDNTLASEESGIVLRKALNKVLDTLPNKYLEILLAQIVRSVGKEVCDKGYLIKYILEIKH